MMMSFTEKNSGTLRKKVKALREKNSDRDLKKKQKKPSRIRQNRVHESKKKHVGVNVELQYREWPL